MKKVGVILVILILFSVSVSAFGLSDFLSWFSGSDPVVTGTQANPIKVFPGQSLQNLVSFEDKCGIESAIAYFPYEGGYDKVEMMLTAGNTKKGTYSASWIVHDTLNMKWYQTKVILTNDCGGETIAYVDWQDPTQNHPFSELTGGTADIGNTTMQLEGNGSYLFMANNTGSDGYAIGLYGESSDSNGKAVSALVSSSIGTNYGVYSKSLSSAGIGVFGWASSVSGITYGVVGRADSPTGYAGWFSGGVGLRINPSSGYDNSSVGNVFACWNGGSPSFGNDCDAVCTIHGLSCVNTLYNAGTGSARSEWRGTGPCSSTCANDISGGNNDGIITCACS